MEGCQQRATRSPASRRNPRKLATLMRTSHRAPSLSIRSRSTASHCVHVIPSGERAPSEFTRQIPLPRCGAHLSPDTLDHD